MKIYYSVNGGSSWTFMKVIPDANNATTTYWM